MTMVRPLTKPIITGCGMSVTKRPPLTANIASSMIPLSITA